MNQPIATSKSNGNLRWILVSRSAGLIAGVLMQVAFYNWYITTGAFFLIGGIVFWHNPRWIYRRAFATFLGLTVGVGALFNFDIEGTFWGAHFHIYSDSVNPTLWFATCAIICLAMVFLDENGILEKWIDRNKKNKQSFQSFIDQVDIHSDQNITLEINSSRRFWYKADLFLFVGRKEELKQLNEFCAKDSKISWLAITGRGGLGKSRLAYKFVKESCTGWKMLFIDWSYFLEFGCLEFDDYEYKSNLLIVIDYVSKDAESIGKWLKKICTQNGRKHKIRIVFLQREGITKTKIGEENFPVWYDQLMNGAERDESVRHQLYNNTFLALPKLSVVNLKRIIVNYIETNKVASPSEEQLNQLIQSLKEIDANFQRPIYALFLADAWIENSEKVLQWNIKNLQEWLNTHEIKKINIAFNGKKKSQKALQYLLTLATALEKIDITTLEAKPFADSVSILQKFSSTKQTSLTRLIRSMDLYSESEEDGIILHGIVPDIMGEYYCLTYLKELAENNDSARLDAFIQTAWKEQYANAFKSFLIRCINDFESHKMTRWLISYVPKNTVSIEHYSSVLRYLSSRQASRQEHEKAEETLDQLKQLFDTHQSDKILISYAKGLATLTLDQDKAGTIETIEKLERISIDHPIDQVLIEYSKGLINLIIEESEDKSILIVEKIKQLSIERPINDIIIQYAKGLFVTSLRSKSQAKIDENLEYLREIHREKQLPETAEILDILEKTQAKKSTE